MARATYPDATFTLRLSYGQVQGLSHERHQGAAQDHVLRAVRPRATASISKAPFDLPSRYAEGRDKLNLATPLDFVTTNDIIGGNSGSPVINRNGEIVGLVFDGNIESLVGDFVYDGADQPHRGRAHRGHDRSAAQALQRAGAGA